MVGDCVMSMLYSFSVLSYEIMLLTKHAFYVFLSSELTL